MRVGIIIASLFLLSSLLSPLIHELFGRRASNRLFRVASFFPPFLTDLAAEPNESVLTYKKLALNLPTECWECNLPEEFSQPGDHLLLEPRTSQVQMGNG